MFWLKGHLLHMRPNLLHGDVCDHECLRLVAHYALQHFGIDSINLELLPLTIMLASGTRENANKNKIEGF